MDSNDTKSERSPARRRRRSKYEEPIIVEGSPEEVARRMASPRLRQFRYEAEVKRAQRQQC